MPKPIRKKLPVKKGKKPIAKAPSKATPQLAYLRLRIASGCPRCCGTLEVGAGSDGFGYGECVTCRISYPTTLPEVLALLEQVQHGQGSNKETRKVNR